MRQQRRELLGKHYLDLGHQQITGPKHLCKGYFLPRPNWVRQAEVDGGKRPGTSTVDAKRIAELERENRELRRANEILKAASAFFARELDPRLPK